MEEKLNYPIKVIYAEDNPLDVDLTTQVFKDLKDKFEFEFVMTGKELIEKIKEESFDIILLDNHLPDIEGVDLIQKITNLNIKTPIVIITGLGDEELVLKAIRFGAVDYISKTGNYLEKLPDYLERIYELSKSVKQFRYHVRVEQIKVLYIEHNLQDIELLERYIFKEHPNIIIKSITSTPEAFKLLNEENFDLILIDLRMPDMDGIEFTRRLKESGKEIPIIIITGKGDEKSAIEALKLGVYDYVNKDIDYIEKLPRIIETSYLRYKYERSLLNHEKKYLDLTITLEQQYQERTISLIQEIERRKGSELKFRELYLLFENFLNTLSDMVVVKDKEFKVFFVNKQWERFFGLNLDKLEEGLKNKSFLSFKSQNSKYDLIVKETGKPYKDLIKVSDLSGNERIFEVIVSPIFNIENEFDGVISLYRDITEHIELQNALKKSEERYRSFVSNSSEIIVCFEFEKPLDINLSLEEQINAIYKFARLSECNSAFLEVHKFNSLEEAINLNFGYFYPFVSEQNRIMLKNFIINNYSVKHFETQKIMQDGSVSYFSENLTGIVEDNKLIRIWGVKRDITELKRLNFELEERVKERTAQLLLANTELESFNYSVSHDLKAPLRAIVGFSDIILMDYKDNLSEEVVDYIQDIRKNGLLLQDIIDELLRLSKITLQELKKTEFQLSEVISEIIAEQKSNWRNLKTKIIIKEMPKIFADRGLLKIALTNLISNAVKFSSKVENPEVEIGFQENEKEYIIYVKDNGIGFNKSYYNKLFQPFQRLHDQVEYPGTGIGLAIVKRVASKHNGKVWAESELNRGATFYISIPKTNT